MLTARIARHTLLIAAATSVLASCGSGAAPQDAAVPAAAVSDPGEAPDLPVAAASAASPLPMVTVRDVTNDEWVQFADLLPADKPILAWFWAPH